MKTLAALLLMLLAAPASAAVLTPGSTLIVYADAVPGVTRDSIVILNNSPPLPPNEFGDFTRVGVEVNNGMFLDLNWRNIGQEIIVQQMATGSNLACGASCLFSFGNSERGIGGWFNVSTVDQTVLPPLPDISDVIVHGTGIMSFVGINIDPSYGVWSFSMRPVAGSPHGWWGSFGYMAVPTPVPAPAVGIGLGPLLAGMWLIRRYRRRNA
jgi:hypothetical protein